MKGSKPPVGSIHAWIAAGFLFVSCGSQHAAAPESVPESAPEVSAGGDAEPVAQNGTQNYKAEQIRLAMRGIRYEGGVLTIDHEVARTMVSGPSASASAEALAEGRRLIDTNHRNEALAAMTRAVLLAPESAETYEGLGDALTVRRKYVEAAAAFSAGLERAPTSVSLLFKLGDIQVRLNEREQGIALFRQALELDPTHAKARERLALQLYYTGQTAQAWTEVHLQEAAGSSVPPQFRALLARAHPEPTRVQSEEK